MTMEGIGLFSGLEAKLKYVDKSQSVISQNIANADTPNFRPKELSEVDFGRLVKTSLQGAERRIQRLSPEITNSGHMTGYGNISDPRTKKQGLTYEIAPAGNSVILEEQMIAANKNLMEQSLLNRVLLKNTGMIKKAIGSNGR